jgi:hypothetical protein
MASSSSKTLEIKRTDVITDADKLIPIPPLRSLIFSYLDDSKDDKSKYQNQLSRTLFGNVAALYETYATQIARNLLWHIDIEETLLLAKKHPECLNIEVEVKDIHGQRVRGKPVQILASAKDVNLREMKPDEKPYGMVEQLRPCFSNDDDFVTQLQEYFGPGSEEEMKKRMTPYIDALNTFSEELIEAKIPPGTPFEALLNLPIANKFRQMLLTPDPSHVVLSGDIFDLQIVLSEFLKIFDTKTKRLGGLYSDKMDAFCVVVYGTLQRRGQCSDLEVVHRGVGPVVDSGQTPERLNFSQGLPKVFLELGVSHFLSYSHAWLDGFPDNPHLTTSPFIQLMSNKNINAAKLTRPQPSKNHCAIM